MIEDQLTPEEQNLVQQIQATSKPQLASAVREAIRQQMLNEFQMVVVSGQPHPSAARPQLHIYLGLALVAAAVIIMVSLVMIRGSNPTARQAGATASITVPPGGQIAIVPSVTAANTVVVETSTVVVTEMPSSGSETPSSIPATTQPIVPTSVPLVSNPTIEPETSVVVEGPITSINNNIVTIYGFSIEVEAQHPILKVIDVGDVVRVQGTFDSGGTLIASTVSNIPNTTSSSTATVGLDGPIEAINDNTIMVNGIPVQLAPDDPLLQTVKVGNFVSVQGNFQSKGSTIVLVVVNIAIVNNNVIPSQCWYHDDGMGMGHWHCDGMGMGDAMGMGDDGMGMGDAMGMGG